MPTPATQRDRLAPGRTLLAAGDDLPSPGFEGVVDRFMIDGSDTGGRFALVQHLFAPKALAAPMHRHHDEDEYTFVLTGRIGAILQGEEVVAEPGDLLFKPRGQWHTFWNAGDTPCRILEIISPGGFEQFFAERGDGSARPDAGARYGLEFDLESIPRLCEEHGLTFERPNT